MARIRTCLDGMLRSRQQRKLAHKSASGVSSACTPAYRERRTVSQALKLGVHCQRDAAHGFGRHLITAGCWACGQTCTAGQHNKHKERWCKSTRQLTWLYQVNDLMML